jgi:hypothetical protein
MADKILSQSAFSAVINAPIEWVDGGQGASAVQFQRRPVPLKVDRAI